MRKRFSMLIAFLAAITPSVVYGHQGHGSFDGLNPWHYVTSPLHLISAIILIAVFVFGVRYLGNRSKQTK